MRRSLSVARDELVSCIMPTRDRPAFLAQAIRCFQQQTHRLSELIVIDDGEQPVADVCAEFPGVAYLRLDRRTPTGTKMNIGIEHARGCVLQKLDDDDYYHPQFLEISTSQLLHNARDRAIVAWDCFLVLLAGERSVRYSGHGWSAGGTLCFSRKLWKRKPFRAEMRGSDGSFRRDHGNRVVPVCAPEHYILVRHGGNTWTHMAGPGMLADEYLARLPIYPKPLRALVGPTNRRFYASLSAPYSSLRSTGTAASQMLPVSSRSARIRRSAVTDGPAAAGRAVSPSSDSLAWWKC
jgi:glycosyltransferase involved in cell wall biosynthesis